MYKVDTGIIHFNRVVVPLPKLYLKMSAIVYSLSQKGPYNNSEDKFCLVKKYTYFSSVTMKTIHANVFSCLLFAARNRLLDGLSKYLMAPTLSDSFRLSPFSTLRSYV